MKKAKRCNKGFSCGSACISRAKKCVVALTKGRDAAVKKTKEKILEHLPHAAEHLAQATIAWKTGKVIGPMISSALETQYGIPQETSRVIAESVVQAAAAVTLGARDIKTMEDLIRKSVVEFSAAFVGKVSHSAAESAIASMGVRQSIEQAVPILAGKISGISVATVGSKLPSISQVSSYISRRYKQDTALLANALNLGKLQFSEEDENLQQVAEFLSLLSVVSLVYYNERPQR